MFDCKVRKKAVISPLVTSRWAFVAVPIHSGPVNGFVSPMDPEVVSGLGAMAMFEPGTNDVTVPLPPAAANSPLVT